MKERKKHRLNSELYNRNGAYFITICAHHRRCIFSQISNEPSGRTVVSLKPYGEIVEDMINMTATRFGMQIDKYVIMPNHIHMILSIDEPYNVGSIHESTLHRRSKISQAIGYLKMHVTKRIHMIQPDETVWQRSYYDHIIRGRQDYDEVWNYIDNNPAKWLEDRFYET